MKFSLTTKLGFLSFGGVYLALAVILGSLYVLRSEGRLIKQLDEFGATLSVSYTHLTLPTKRQE